MIESYTTEYKINLVRLLVNHPDIDVNSEDNNGDTPLILAARKMQPHDMLEKIMRILLSHPNINVNCKNKAGRTALSYAEENGNVTIIQMLKSHGAV